MLTLLSDRVGAYKRGSELVRAESRETPTREHSEGEKKMLRGEGKKASQKIVSDGEKGAALQKRDGEVRSLSDDFRFLELFWTPEPPTDGLEGAPTSEKQEVSRTALEELATSTEHIKENKIVDLAPDDPASTSFPIPPNASERIPWNLKAPRRRPTPPVDKPGGRPFSLPAVSRRKSPDGNATRCPWPSDVYAPKRHQISIDAFNRRASLPTLPDISTSILSDANRRRASLPTLSDARLPVVPGALRRRPTPPGDSRLLMRRGNP
jgi:hypothetical protein